MTTSTTGVNLRQELAIAGIPTFQYIVENSIDAILMTDTELQIVYANRACNQLLAQNVIGQPLTAFWFAEDLPLLNSAVEWARASGFFSSARLNGFHSIVDQYPDVEIVGTLAADWNREKGYQAAEEFLKAHPPGTLDVIWTASNEMGLGAMQAVEAAGRQGEIKIFTNDVTPESVERIREGRLMAETHHGFPEWGWYTTKFAVMLALGQDVPSTFDIRPRTVYQENADLFYPAPDLESIDWAGLKAGQTVPEKIVIGWVQMTSSGVYQTATNFFEKAAAEARQHGINVDVITRLPATPEDFVGQAAIIEDYIRCQVDAIVISTMEMEIVRQALKKANQAGIPVIIVNQLEPIAKADITCYIGFDNTVAGKISGYAVVNYLGGPGVLGKKNKIDIEPGTYLDLAWWQTLYEDVDPNAIDAKGRVAIIEGISGNWRGENRLVRADQRIIYVDAFTFPVHKKWGQLSGLVASLRDVTARKQAEQALAQAYQEVENLVEERTAELKREINERKRAEAALQSYAARLKESNQELEQFAYIASHDLQEPLRMIKSYLKLLEKRYQGQLDEAADKFIDFAVDGANRLHTLINDLLKYSQVGTQGKPFAPTNCDEVLAEVLKNLKIAIEECKARVTYDNLPTVMGDGVQLAQLFQNLISNGLKFHKPEIPPKIHIGVEHGQSPSPGRNHREGEWLFSVQDNGIGMAPHYFEQIFLPFHRLHTPDKYRGTGIGLAVCKKIVERHGGRIWVESESNEGTTFYFTIPAG